MAKGTPQEVAAKWRANLVGSVGQIEKGIDRVTESPGVAAVRQKEAWVAKLCSPEVQEKWARNTAGVNLAEWKEITKAKVRTNLASGAGAAESKQVQFYSQLLPYQENLQGTVNAMRKGTLADSAARMIAWMEGMAKFQKS